MRRGARLGAAVPVGRPISETRVFLLDGGLRPVPVGVVAELYIGGEGVARGYLNRPDWTAERFVPDPSGREPGGRLYRTGDRARYRPTGEIEFLGRIDRQVKVRGFRIEPGEIEAVLRSHAGISEAVVVVREDVPGDRRLVAYVVPRRPGEVPGGAELRALLASRLPEPMLPAAIVVLAELPLTPNGKVDRRALPSPEPERGLEPAAPCFRTLTEELLAAIWSEVLGVERIGGRDDFFELGGHSLLATQVVSRIRESFRVELPLRALFEAPTVVELADRIERVLAAGEELTAPPIEAVPRDGELPLSFAQQRLWVAWRLDPDSAAYNVPLAIRLRGALLVSDLRESLGAAVRRHEMLRTLFREDESGPVQVILPAAPLDLPVVDLGGLPAAAREAELRRLGDAEAGRPFDLSRGPLTRTTLLLLQPEEHAFLLTMHHIISDGWSLRLLLREVMSSYEASHGGKAPPLPDLPVQYGDFAVWQRRFLTEGHLATHLDYWRRHLAGAPPHLDLPTDRPRPPVQAFRGKVLGEVLPATLSGSLKTLGRRENATLFMVLLAAFDVVLHHWTGQDDLVVGTDIAGRARIETEPLIGFFINQLVLRTDLTGNPSFRVLLRQVREVTLNAHLHQDLPFDRLVEALGVERDPGRSPLFQVQLTLQNLPAFPAQARGLAVEPQSSETRTSKLDLLFALKDGEEGLALAVEYDSDLFETTTIRRLIRSFESVLQHVAGMPDTSLAELREKLSRSERERRQSEEKELADVSARLFGAVRRRPARSGGDRNEG